MSGSGGAYVIGDQQIAIFIPSRFRGGGIIPEADQNRVLTEVQEKL